MRNFAILILILPFMIFAQDKPDSSNEKKEETKVNSADSKPMKHESGDVTINPYDVSEGFKQSNYRNLSKLKISMMNHGTTDKFNKLMVGYVDASSSFQERQFLAARKKFEQNAKEIKEECKSTSEKYKSTYSKLAKDASKLAIERKINPEAGSSANLSSVLETHMNNALQTGGIAEDLLNYNPCDSISVYRNSIFQFLMIYYTINKDKNRYLTAKERLEKNLLIDDDYIPAEYIKDYDDSLESISVNREKAREKDREEVKKMISLRYGETKAKDQSGKNPTNEKPSQTSTDNKTETKDEKPNDKK
ncbi:MAG: hypothetical protein L6Q54_03835 [Leptospiraceae bacterium]|nr:hypothetical protein [Leptospiraceae bacterium]MCK6380366.1 hypothetical protein [Leptospiraceae bacterium]NUM41297.1 hypothetical protein [Leptospiraceae bacterium]